MSFSCKTCLKDFKTKGHLDKHAIKKIPCKPSNLVQKLIEANPEIIQEEKGSFSQNSIKMNKELSKDLRKAEGIFFTPRKARDLLFEKLKEFGCNPTTILEPSFGSGEFLDDAKTIYPKAKLYGVEKNEKLFASYKNQEAELKQCDFLKYTTNNNQKMDLIIGNPPYFVTKDKNPKCMVGRPNIYIAFLYKCLEEHLQEDGFLGFVLPTSLFNCSYYEPMRKYIGKHCSILFVKELDVDYYETNQDTMLIIIKKTPDVTQKYIFNRNENIYIMPNYKELQELVKDTKTLKELDFKVKTGDVVWNQEKEKLSDEGTLLIYSSNIIKGELKLENIANKEKKQYIKNFSKKPISQTTILINRGYGNAAYKLEYVLVTDKTFYAENHVNMIIPNSKEATEKIPDVLKSLADGKTTRFIELFSGNGALSKTEIESVLPMYVS